MAIPVLKSASYCLAHTPDLLLYNSSFSYNVGKSNPFSDSIDQVSNNLRTYDEVVNYLPNQVFIGNLSTEDLKDELYPWSLNPVKGKRTGRFGDILPENEFYIMLKLSDELGHIKLTTEFLKKNKEQFKENYSLSKKDEEKLSFGNTIEEIEKMIKMNMATGLYYNNELVGCVKRADDFDPNLQAPVILENLATKATGMMAVKTLLKNLTIEPEKIDYVIDCSESACGSMNQRGGGNFAKAIADGCELKNATGIDLRSFSSSAVHSIIHGAALIKSGIYENVLVVGGGSTAKLGDNALEHIKKGKKVLEDMLAGFAVLITKDDFISPVINTELIGSNKTGVRISPKSIMKQIILEPLKKGKLSITDMDKIVVELQNRELTEEVGGDLPKNAYNIIASLALEENEIEREEMESFYKIYGMNGYAPTQGFIPSGISYIGFAIDMIEKGFMHKVMIASKTSLFLGQLTKLFDGVSFILESNDGRVKEETGEMDQERIMNIIAKGMRELANNLNKNINNQN